MNSVKLFQVALTTSLFVMGSFTLASAAGTSNCDVIYGGGTVCPPSISFTLDKSVQSPTKGGQFVDNLGINDPMFAPSQNVTYQIKVKNTGDSKIEKISIVDSLPSQLTYVSGGNYNSTNKTVTFNVDNLEKGKETVQFISAKIIDAKDLSTSPLCITNSVTATDNQGNKADDTANLCILKPGASVQPQVPTKSIPNTGPEALALFVLPPLGAVGLYLRRRAGL
ncbi:MAG: DUF11 domain-containing protein [Candidatus Levybacteria bacterium]|nr:DUF11 domain-containing protein [Candidatus Levybacteria bacterium]MBP9815217.1 DUF11 domain-containing protein [Candidatus Levybacteria bacterium]